MEDDAILEKTLELFLKYGIKKTSMEMVASEAGITRMTIYRRFTDKKEITRRALLYGVNVFDESLNNKIPPDTSSIDAYLNHFGNTFSSRPLGDAGSILGEAAVLYPKIYKELLAAQHATGKKYFEMMLKFTKKHYKIRKEIKPELLHGIMETLLKYLPENPLIAAVGNNPETLFATITGILLFGIVDTSSKSISKSREGKTQAT